MDHQFLLAEYWLNVQFGGKYKWTTLRHNGVLFPPDYVPHKIPIIYEGEKVYLDPKSEEYATLYARYLESEYTKNNKFNKNFWKDWKKVLGDSQIKSLEGCDFSLIYNHILKQKEIQKMKSKEEKEQIKKEREKDEEKYKTAYVDDKAQTVGNFRIEPPGLFLGRGCHPKIGTVKARIFPEDVIINIDKQAPIPTPPAGHMWKKVIHDRRVVWLASWNDSISGKLKYIWLGGQSNFKAESDLNKFEMARKLKRRIPRIRKENDINLVNDDIKIRQIATALYFIDNLALRVGNEKGEGADTVGVTSLRVEHIKLLNDSTITLDFLGKDSIRYFKTIKVMPTVHNNLLKFSKDKNRGDQLFDLIIASDINKYLQNFMKDLTAKVFRTYNASNLFQKELHKIEKKISGLEEIDKINRLYSEFNKANAKVALLCNHRKKVSSTFNQQIDKISSSIKEKRTRLRKIKKIAKNKERIEKLQKQILELKAKKEYKIQMKGVSLGTSKINYIDPRISVAFMKRNNLDIDKIFEKPLQQKFTWAFEVDKTFKF